MSLKAFHIVFITLSLTLAWGCAALEFQNYQAGGSVLYLAVSVCAFVAGIALLVYGIWFLKKTKNLIL
jgi:hypothetical protein